MCGIAGFSGKYPVDEAKMRWLITLNEDRGMSSTGIFTVGADKNKTQRLIKDTDKASVFVVREDVKDAIRGATSIIAHTRAATFGSVSKANAHPFQFGDITGAHNGFVIAELFKKYGFEKDFEVDSMFIFAYLDKHGSDFKKLKDLEGAITVAYMSKKYPDAINLYRREARELNIGYAKEGIYFSSEGAPLRMIGCSKVLTIPDLTFVSLRNGEILDSMSMDAPIIKTIPFGTKRHEWKSRGKYEEYSKYDELKPSPITPTYKKSPKSSYSTGFGERVIGFKQGNITPDASTLFSDAMDVTGTLCQMVMEDAKYFAGEKLPPHTEISSYGIEDISSGLIVLHLRSSGATKDDLPGWLVFDKAHPEICGITQINGVTILKFPFDQCGSTVTLIMADPVNGDTKFEYAFKPEQGRLQEVSLQLPFPQSKKSTATGSGSEEASYIREKLTDCANAQLSLLPAVVKRNGPILPNSSQVSTNFLESQESVYQRTEKGDIFGTEEDRGGKSEVVLRITNHTSGANSNVRQLIPKSLTAQGIRLILEEEGKTFFFKDEIKKQMNGAEYTKLYGILSTHVGKYFNINRLVNDALILKLHSEKQCKGSSFALGMYMLRLLELMQSVYIKKNGTQKVLLSNLDTIFIDKFREDYRAGVFHRDPSGGTYYEGTYYNDFPSLKKKEPPVVVGTNFFSSKAEYLQWESDRKWKEFRLAEN